jgi:hypothetical protein
MKARPLFRAGLALALAWTPIAAAGAQDGDHRSGTLPPVGYGSLTQSDLSLQLRSDEIEIRFVPLDERVTRLLARDAYRSLNGLVAGRRQQIDSVARMAGTARPGLALVTFFALRAGARYDPQTLTIVLRNRIYRPIGIVPFTPRFTAQQLEVREQVSAIYLFEEEIPVTDAFTLGYFELSSENWSRKQAALERERARVEARSRTERTDERLARPSPPE